MIKMNSTETRPFHGIFFHSILRKASPSLAFDDISVVSPLLSGDRSTMEEAVLGIEEAWICRADSS